MDWGSVGIAVSCGIGCRHGSDLALQWLWLWLWPAAIAPASSCSSNSTPSLELSYAIGAALKKKERKKQTKTMAKLYLIHGGWGTAVKMPIRSYAKCSEMTVVHNT